MTIKLKLLGGGIIICLLLTAALALAVFSFSSLNDGFSAVVTKSGTGVKNSRTTESHIVKADKDLTYTSTGMLAVVDDIHRTNMQVQVLERNIFYMNNSAHQRFQEAEEDIQKDLPNFRNEALVGGSIDAFHQNPEHQANPPASLESRYEGEIKPGGRTHAHRRQSGHQ